MNSRQNQRRALHAKNSVMAKVRNLPLYMKIINVVLAVILAFGIGADWAYAAEFMPDSTSAELTLAYDQSETLTAPSLAKMSNETVDSYEWQIMNPKTLEYIQIANETNSTMQVDYAMLVNMLDSNNSATVRSLLWNSKGDVIAWKDYYINVSVPNKSIDEMVAEQAKAQALANVKPGDVLYLNQNEATDETLQADPNATVAITIRYYDQDGGDLHVTNVLSVETYTAFDAFVDPPFGFKVSSYTHDYTGSDFTITTTDPKTGDVGLYFKSNTGIFGPINVSVYCTFDPYPYKINAFYETLEAGVYPDTPQTFNRTGALSEVIPTPTDEKFLTEQTDNGVGWVVAFKESGKTVQQEVTEEVIVRLNRTYSIMSFDCGEDSSNGPVAVYIKKGENFNSVSSWKVEGTNQYKPQPEPSRTVYTFKNWYYFNDSGTRVDMPKDDWSGRTAPGKDTRYYADWDYNGSEKVTIVIAYWAELAESYEYEYVEERYDQVDYEEYVLGGKKYKLPTNGRTYQEYSNPSDPKNDRRYPQNRVGNSQFDLDKNNPEKTIPNLLDYDHKESFTYDSLYFYRGDSSQAEGVTVKADGTTVVNVLLNRKVNRIRYSGSTAWRESPTDSYIFAKWNAKIYSGTAGTSSGIWDPRYSGDIDEKTGQVDYSHTQNGYVEACTKHKANKWTVGSDQAANLMAYMPYQWNNGTFGTHNPTDPYDSYNNITNYYWRYLNCEAYSQSSGGMYRYYLQSVGTEFNNWGRVKAGGAFPKNVTDANNALAALRKTAWKADMDYNNNKEKYAHIFGISSASDPATYQLNGNNGSGMANTFPTFFGFQDPEHGVDSAYQSGVDSRPFSGIYSNYNTNQSDGWSFYYKRDTNPVYLKNVYGSEALDPVYTPGVEGDYSYTGHYDNCITINSEVQYGMPFNEIALEADETQEAYKDQPAKDRLPGLSGLKEGMTFAQLYQIYSKTYPGWSNPIIPTAMDQNLIFDGFYEDSDFAAKIDPATWKMPDHQQDIYARWIKPEINIRFNNFDYEETPTGDSDLSQITTYGEITDVEYTHPVSTDDKRFVSWYYYASAEDKAEGIETWYNPDNMDVPMVGTAGTDPDRTTKEGVPRTEGEDYTNDYQTLDLYQRWLDETSASYAFKFGLWDTVKQEWVKDGNNIVEVARPITGRDEYTTPSHVGPKPSYDATNKPVTDFYNQYRGIVSIAPDTPSVLQFENGLDKDSSKNELWFKYSYDDAYEYAWIYYYKFYNSEGQAEQIAFNCSGESFDNPYILADGEGHAGTCTWTAPAIDPTTKGNVTVPVKLVSTQTIMKNCDPDRTKNVLEFYYEMYDTVDFTYVPWTVDSTGSKIDADGGTVNPTRSEGWDPILPADVYSTSQATAKWGFKLQGWYYPNADGNAPDLNHRVPDSSVVDGLIKAPKDNLYYYYNDATYFAVFTYDEDVHVNINYNLVVLDGAGYTIDTPAGIEIDRTSEGNLQPITGTATGCTVTIPDKWSNIFSVKNWTNSAGAEVAIAGTLKYTPQKVSQGNYSQYETDTYTVYVQETSTPVNIRYVVSSHCANRGNFIPNDKSGAKTDYTEEVYPYTGKPQSVVANAATKYKFQGWAVNTDSTESIDGNLKEDLDITTHSKDTNGCWKSTTYYLFFDFDELNVYFTCDTTGYLTGVPENPPLVVKYSSTFNYVTNADGTSTLTVKDAESQEETAVTSHPYIGYQLPSATWVLVDATGAEVPIPTSHVITEDMTFKAKFEEQQITLTYKPTSRARGYVAEGPYSATATPADQVTQRNIHATATTPPTVVTAYPMPGYVFDFWTVDTDSETAPHYQTTDAATVQVVKDKQTVGGTDYYAYQTHTLYAHFKLYESIKVNFIVNENCQTAGTPWGTVSGIDDLPITVWSNTTFAATSSGSSVSTVGNFALTGPAEKESIDYGTETATGDSTHHFAYWQLATPTGEAGKYTYSNLPDPAILNKGENAEYTFAAYFEENGETEYTVKYWQEKVDAAKNNPGHGYDPQYYADEPTHEVTLTGKIGSKPSIEHKSYTGFNYSGMDPTEGTFEIKEDTSLNIVNVYHNRMTDYPYIVDFYTVDPNGSVEVKTDWTEYWYCDVDGCWPNPDKQIEGGKYEPAKMSGIFGDTVWVPKNPWSPGKDVVFWKTDPKYDDETKSGTYTYDHTYWGTVTQELEFVKYEIGKYGSNTITDTKQADTFPNCGVYNVFYTRNPEMTFHIHYKLQKEDLTTWEDIAIDSTNAPETSKQFFKGVDGLEFTIVNTSGTGGPTLAINYDITKWRDKIPGKGDETYEHYFKGFVLDSFQPSNGILVNSTYNELVEEWPPDPEADNPTEAYANIYFRRADDVQYKVNYIKETEASAIARYNHTATEPVYDTDGKVTETGTGRTGQVVDLVNDTIKNKYTGYEYVGAESSFTTKSDISVKILGDGTAEANIYYTRDLANTFRVTHSLQDLNSDGTDVASTYTLQPSATTTYNGPTGATLKLESDGKQSFGDIVILKEFAGYTINWSKTTTVPADSTTIQDNGALVVNLFYDRNVTNLITVKYMKQDIDQITWLPKTTYTEVVADRETITGTATAKVITGAKYNFGTKVVEDKYKADGFKFKDTIPAKDGENYYVVVKPDGTTEVQIRYDRLTGDEGIPYEIHYMIKKLDGTGYDEKTTEKITGKATTGQNVPLPKKELIGYVYEKMDPVSGVLSNIEPTYVSDVMQTVHGYVYYTRSTTNTYRVWTYFQDPSSAGTTPIYYEPVEQIIHNATTGAVIDKTPYTGHVDGYIDPPTTDPTGDFIVAEDGNATLKVYYNLSGQTPFKINYFVESYDHAAKKETNLEGYEPYAEKPFAEFTGYAGTTIDLTHTYTDDPIYVPDLTAKGYTLYTGPGTTASLEIKHDGTAEANVYYNRRVSLPYKIQFMLETVEHAAWRAQGLPAEQEPTIKGTIDADATKTKDDGFYMQEVSTLESSIAHPNPLVEYQKYLAKGFVYDPGENPHHLVVESLDPANPSTATIFYIRKLDIEFTVNYWLETINSATWTTDTAAEGVVPEKWYDEIAEGTESPTMGAKHAYHLQDVSYANWAFVDYVVDLSLKEGEGEPPRPASESWITKIDGFLWAGYKNNADPKVVMDPTQYQVTVKVDAEQNVYNIYYTRNASEEFKVNWKAESVEHAEWRTKDWLGLEAGSEPDWGWAVIEGQNEETWKAPKGAVINKDSAELGNTDNKLARAISGYYFKDTDPTQITVSDTEVLTITARYLRDYYIPDPPDNPPIPDPPGPQYQDAGFNAMYYVQTLGDDGKPSTNYNVDSEDDFDAVYGATVTLDYQSLYHGDQKVLKKAIKGYTFDHATLTVGEADPVPFTDSSSFNVNSLDDPSQIVRLYYNVDYYEPPTPPNPPSDDKPGAFTVHYMLQTVDAARAGQDTPGTDYYTEASATDLPSGVTSPEYFGGYYNATVKLDYVDPESTPAHKFTFDITGFNYRSAQYKANATATPVTFDNNNPFNIDINEAGMTVAEKHPQHVYFYFTREYYPDPPIPTPEPKDYGFTVKYLGQDINTGQYTIPLTNSVVTSTDGILPIDAFFGEEVNATNYKTWKSIAEVAVYQEFTNYTLSETKAPEGLPLKVDSQHNQQITLYYDADYIEPTQPAFTVTYKGLDPAKAREATHAAADYTVTLSNTVVTDGQLKFGAYMSQKVKYDYVEPNDPKNAIVQTFKGYSSDDINWALTQVDGTTTGKGFELVIDGGTHGITLYYDCDKYIPEPPEDPGAFQVHYMLQTLDAARAGNDDITDPNAYKQATTEITSPQYFAGYYGETVNMSYKDADDATHVFVTSITGYDYKEATYKATSAATPVQFDDLHTFTISITDAGTHEQEIFFYFKLQYYPPPGPPTPDPEDYGFRVKYLGQDVNTGQYTKLLTNDVVGATGILPIDAFYSESITADNYKTWESKAEVKVNQEFDFYTLNEAKTLADGGLPITVDQNHNKMITLYYDANYIGPDPDPAFTVTYKGLDLDKAGEGTHSKDDYNVALANGTVTGGTLGFGAFMGANITKAYQEPQAPYNYLVQEFKGFSNINWALTEVDGDVKGEDFSLEIKGTGHTVTLYYDRDVYPDDPDNYGYKITHMVQSLDFLLYGEGPEYIEYVDPNTGEKAVEYYEAAYEENITKDAQTVTDSKDAFVIKHTVSGEPGFIFENRIECVPDASADSITITDPATYGFKIYYTRNRDARATYLTTRMFKNPDFVMGTSAEEWVKRDDQPSLEHEALYEETVVNADRVDLWEEKVPENYFFTKVCDPTSINPWKDVPTELSFTADAEGNEMQEITGYYDMVEYPTPEHVDAQTGDSMPIVAVLGIGGLAAVGLFLAMKRRKRLNAKH